MSEPTPSKRKNGKMKDKVERLRGFGGKATLREMCEATGIGYSYAHQLCSTHKIPFIRQPKGARKENHWRTNAKAMAEAEAAANLAQMETYTDADGRTVTRCPPRYARGVGLGRYSAKPTGSHHD